MSKNNILKSASSVKKLIPINKTFTLVAGCFDLFHIGHIHLLEYASTLEDLLVVAVLSDKKIRMYKSHERPIINQKQRAVILSSLKYVDFVYISDIEPNDPKTLKLLKPNSVVYSNEIENVRKVKKWKDNIKIYSPNTKVRLLPRYNKEEISTSHIIERIRN